jgi:hypothetical protein
MKFRDLVRRNTLLERIFPEFPNIYLSRNMKSVPELYDEGYEFLVVPYLFKDILKIECKSFVSICDWFSRALLVEINIWKTV